MSMSERARKTNTTGDVVQERLTNLLANSGGQGGKGFAQQNAGAQQDYLLLDLPAIIVTASSDGTCMIFEIPVNKELTKPIMPSMTLYHPSYCYSARAHPTVFPGHFFVVAGGHDYGMKVWRV